jgi:hypothetical protein
VQNRFDFDGALKDVFQHDHPTLLNLLTGGSAVREFLNVELPSVREKRVDLVLSLQDGTVLHIEFQSSNDPNMAYRMLEYWPPIKRRLRRPLRQVVLYVGQAKPKMPDRLVEDGLRFRFRVMDIREIKSEVLMKSGNDGISLSPSWLEAEADSCPRSCGKLLELADLGEIGSLRRS